MQTEPCKYRIIGFAFLFLLGGLCFAQEIQVFHAEGGDFAYTSGGRRVMYQPERLGREILSLNREDIIQTGPGSFVEIRINPGGTRIKVAENTSLVCGGGGSESGSLVFSILYGRVRLSTAGYWPAGEGGAVFIRSGTAEVVFRSGDAGIDFVVSPEETHFSRGEPVFRVYLFSGTTELIPSVRPEDPAAAPRFLLRQPESLAVETMNPLSYLERKPLEQTIVDYWNRHNFSDGGPLLSIGVPELSAPPPPVSRYDSADREASPAVPPPPADAAPAEDGPDEKTVIRYRNPDYGFFGASKVKNSFILTGGILTLGGIVMQTISSYHSGGLDDRTAEILRNYGYFPLSLGFFFLGGGLLINPKPPESDAAK
ncbi:MAG: FecR family protein [Treponema sp.]|jgi:hypothetical protein|nr:FecR family protein [Treponema sp.]